MTHPGRRRAVILVLVIVCGLLSLFPQRYRSAVTLAPTDPATLGLSGTLSQLGAGASVFGNQAAVEVTMRVAGSVDVRRQVIDRLDLVRRLHFGSPVEASRWLNNAVNIQSLRGGVVQMETKQKDSAFGEALISAYAEATRQRLAVINRQQTGYKRRVLEQLVNEADKRLDDAQLAYDNFRLKTRYSDPTSAITAIGDRIPVIQAAIKANDVQINAARQFATDDNMQVKQLVAEKAALEQQLAELRETNPEQTNSVGRVVLESTESRRLERKLSVALNLYENYNRYLQGTSVEDLTSSANLRVIEPPFVDTARQVNYSFLALTALFLLLGIAMEFYQLRPPLEPRSVS